MKSLETQIAELTEAAKTQQAEITRLQGVIAKADKTVAASKLAEMCKEAALPQVAADKLAVAFKDAVNTDGMQEAVNTEKKYVDSLKEAAPIRRNNSGTVVEEGSAKMGEMKEAQVKAFIASGYSKAEAEAMSGIE